MELFKLLSANEIVAQLICFFTLLWLLRKFMWGKFLKVIDDRREKIASEFKAIESAKQEVEALKVSYEEKITGVNEEARHRLEGAVAEGKKIAQDIVAKAEDEAGRVVDSARESVKVELAKAKEELKSSVVEITIAATEKLIQEKLSDKNDKVLVEQLIKELSSGEKDPDRDSRGGVNRK